MAAEKKKGISKKVRNVIIAAGIIVVAAAVTVVLLTTNAGTKAANAKTTESQVRQGDLTLGFTSDGTAALPVQNLDFSVSGTVKAINVVSGQKVKAGDVLAEVSTDELQDQLDEANDALTKAKLSLKDAKAQRSLNLLSSKQQVDQAYDQYVSTKAQNDQKVADEKAILDTAIAAYNTAKTEYEAGDPGDTVKKKAMDDAKDAMDAEQTKYNKVKSSADKSTSSAYTSYSIQKQRYSITSGNTVSVDNAQVNVDTATKNQTDAQANMSKSQLTAPADGTILNITKSVGDAITAAGTTTSGQNATTGFIVFVPDARTIQITASISETDIAQVQLDQFVSVTFDGVGDTAFTGKVADIRSVPKVDNTGLVSYSVTAKLDSNDNAGKIMQGMTCTINFISKQVQNVLYIHYRAVYMEDGIQYVDMVKEDGSTEKRQVKTGLSDGTNVEVSTGLERGETVIVRSGSSAAK